MARPRVTHKDLQTFLQYVQKGSIDATTTVYKGTLYEYIVQSALMRRFGDAGLGELTQVGGAADAGIDLLGSWKNVPVIVQCKCWVKQKVPANIWRELSGIHHHFATKTGGGPLMILATPSRMTRNGMEAFQGMNAPFVHCQIPSLAPVYNAGSGQLEVDIGPTTISNVATNSAAATILQNLNPSSLRSFL